jgi:hypothetical protein
MISAAFQVIESHWGARLGLWSGWAHILVLALLVADWARPVALWAWRRRLARRRSWSPTWICPCGHANPATSFSCHACDDGPGLLAKVKESPGFQRLRRAAALAGLSIRVAGGVFYYAATFLAATRFRFFSFHQQPLQELLASAALLLLLAAFHYGRRAFSFFWTSVFARFTDLVAGAVFASLFLGLWVLWAAAPSLAGKALSAVAVTPDGLVRIQTARERRIQSGVNPETGAVLLPVTYAHLTWPLFQADETFVVKVGTQPVVTWLGARLLTRLAPRWTSDDPLRPRLVLLNQNLEAPPPGRYEIVKAKTGEGLRLRPAEGP